MHKLFKRLRDLKVYILVSFSGLYLDDEGLVLETRTHAQLAHVGRLVDEVLDAVENSSACCGDPTVDSSLADGLPGDAGVSVDVLTEKSADLHQLQYKIILPVLMFKESSMAKAPPLRLKQTASEFGFLDVSISHFVSEV